MPHLSFFLGEGGVGVFGIPMGVANFIVAWDPFDGGAGDGMGIVYQKITMVSVIGGGRVRAFGAVQAAASNLDPDLLVPGKGRVLSFKIECSTALTGFVNLTFKVFENSKLVYNAADGTGQETLQVKIKGFVTASSFSYMGTMDRTDDQDIFDSLMTDDGDLITLPFAS
jgi:hypothetical protein